MPFLKYFLRLQYMDFLIRRKATGNLEKFAQKNRLSKRALANVIKEMKEMGFPIQFDRLHETYFYTKAGTMPKKLFIDEAEALAREELRKLRPQDVQNLCFSEESIFEPCEEPSGNDRDLPAVE